MSNVDLRGMKTPSQHLYKREGGGNKMFTYVKQGYVMSWLDKYFDSWTFRILNSFYDEFGYVNVIGELEVVDKNQGQSYGTKRFIQAIGSKQVTKRRSTGEVTEGMYYKAAETDALKRCARMLGCANDIYMNEDLESIEIRTEEEAKTFYKQYLPTLTKLVDTNQMTEKQCLNLITNYFSGMVEETQFAHIKE